ncbi:hypothetical protein MASR2M12_13290 [Bacteroidales bacterium]
MWESRSSPTSKENPANLLVGVFLLLSEKIETYSLHNRFNAAIKSLSTGLFWPYIGLKILNKCTYNFIVKNKKTMRSRGGLTVSASVGKAAVLNGVIRNDGEQNLALGRL